MPSPSSASSKSRHGGGAFVTDLEPRTLLAPLDLFLSLSEANLKDAFATRRLIETEMTRRAAQAATDEDVHALRSMMAAHESIQTDPVRSASGTATFTR